MRPFSILTLSMMLTFGGATLSDSRAELPGWQELRVIEQKGRPSLMRAADLDGDGREELIVVNSRLSRLDIYAWRDIASTSKIETEPLDASRPNELPLAPDWELQELQLENVPRDALVQDLDGDDQPELIVLVSSPNQVVVYRRQPPEERETNAWEKQYKIDLLDGEIPSRRDALLLRPTKLSEEKLSEETKEFQLLVSMNNGIQQMLLKPGGQAQWMTPREQRGRVDWWLADLDNDGHDDLVEQTRESNESVRWYRAAENGTLTPAAVLHDRAVKDVEVVRTGAATQLVVIDGTVSGILRRYELALGTASPFGLQRPLAMKEGPKAVWCGMWQGEKRALVVADRRAPRLLSYGLGEAGWETQQAFPALTDIRAMATLTAEPGTLLLWTKDAADLWTSRWESGRLTYPVPKTPSAEVADVEDRKILALDSVGPITWWVQKVGKDLDLYLAKPQMAEAKRIRFPKVGTKADQVLWIGGERLLVKETHGRALKLFSLEEGKTKVTSPMHLKKATLGEFKLFATGDDVRLGRLTDGVLQWLGDDLRSQEQVMLPQGLELSDYVAENETLGWALQRDSPFVHRIEIDASRLSRSVERVKLAEGTGLLRDPVLGMLLLGQDRITHLSEGRSRELKLVDVIDERIGRAGGVRKTRFHQLSSTDIDRDGYDDLILYDQLQHRLTVLGDQNGQLVPKIAWPVFDDKVYPYSNESDNLVKEPRAVLAADFDGDGLQDLAILSHDRLIIYLAREKS
ncbi:MAG: VCBS repeat-containing protein [Planctomycetes bacterium]|nr:VCBS repeat-containing protein [Planctomycetota bacterium]